MSAPNDPNQPDRPSPGDPLDPGSPQAPPPPPPAPAAPPPAPAAPPAAPAAPPPAAQPPVPVAQPAQPPAVPPPAQPPAPAQPAMAAPVDSWAVKRGIVRVVVLLLVSFGFYLFYWFYKTREQVTKELGTYDNVGGQTVGLIVPILNWFIIYWLLRDIAESRRRAGLQEDIEPILMLVIWFFLSPVGLAMSQNQLNQYWDVRSQGHATDIPLKVSEIAIAVIPGILFFAFWVLIIVLIAAAGTTSSSVILPPF